MLSMFFSYMISAVIRIGMPTAVTAAGACFAQRTGVNNLGLEGFMTMGAFLAVVGSHITGNPWVGLLFACLAGGLLSLAHGFATITCGASMFVSSQGLVMISNGLVSVGLISVFGSAGFSDPVNDLTKTPILKNVPIVGDYLSSLSPFVYVGLLAVVILWWVMYKTPLGLRMMACGEHPKAADTAGIPVNTLRYVNLIISGMLGGLGGSMLSIGMVNVFQEGMIAGRGSLAFGAVMLGGFSLHGAFWASLLFGFFDALQLFLQSVPGLGIPSQFIQMIPYVACMVVLIVTSSPKRVKNSKAPAALGKSYSFIAGTR